jgi:hypothetical protein
MIPAKDPRERLSTHLTPVHDTMNAGNDEGFFYQTIGLCLCVHGERI